MGLKEYKEKRKFDETPEPEGKKHIKKGSLKFVIQRHDASRLHYDLRLEFEGVLLSWAVPKGPSLNPSDKRLAIQTEDHPYEYLFFEGEIPKGNYGAGTMTIWDSGTYNAPGLQDKASSEKAIKAGLKNGNLKIELHGERVKGEFALVKIKSDEKQDQWLMIKHKDEFAVDEDYDSEDFVHASVKKGSKKEKDGIEIIGYGNPSILENLPDAAQKAKMPSPAAPMLAKLIDAPFDDKKWIFEIKWDGYRAIAEVKNGKATLWSRNGKKFDKYPAINKDLNDLPYDVILDGEIVILDKEGKADFQKLQNINSASENQLFYYVFDILYFNGFDLTQVELLERKEILKQVVFRLNRTKYSDHIVEKGKEFFKLAQDHDLEGIIGKRANSKYYLGKRSPDWVKIKTQKRQEAIVCGYTAPKKGRQYFGSLILGVYENEKLKYIGSSGGGFKDTQLSSIHKKLQKLEQKESPFDEKIPGSSSITWVKPELICEVAFSEWTKDGKIRHPVFMGLRTDKEPEQVKKEKEEPAKKVKKEAEEKKPELITDKKVSTTKKGGKKITANGKELIISNWEKVYWPEEGYTKGDLIEYYDAVAKVMLPYLKDRPESLNRFPDGIYGESFYQKDMEGLLPEWIDSFTVDRESTEGTIKYMLCQNKAALLFMANLGCIEINPWCSSVQKPDHPDFIVIDIDPSEKSTFDEVIEVAIAVKEVLDKGKIEGYPKTSGSSGIHIYIPLGAKYTYEQGRNFANVIAIMANKKLPKLTSLERIVKKRKDKIYIDYLQNAKGQTLAAPYSARPKPGATVSAPLEWNELKPGLTPQLFTIKNMPDRIKYKGDLFKGAIGKGVDILKCIERLQK